MDKRMTILTLFALCVSCTKPPQIEPPQERTEDASPAISPQQKAQRLIETLGQDNRIERFRAVRQLGELGYTATGSSHSALVDIADYKGGPVVKIGWYTGDNPLGGHIQAINRCFVLPKMARALVVASHKLKKQGFQLVVKDCYRPLTLQRRLKFSHAGHLAASPARGKHPCGAAVDVMLLDAVGNELLLLPPNHFPKYFRSDAKLNEPYRSRRKAMRTALLQAGLKGIGSEFWHFELKQRRSGLTAYDIPVEALPNWNAGPRPSATHRATQQQDK